MRNITLILMLFLMSTFCLAQVPKKAETVSIKGKNIYYEVYGAGAPLIMLHGYSLSSKAWLPYVSDFDKDHEVYLIDLTGHGRSEAFKEDLSIKSVAEDLNSLIRYLELERVKAIGFSFGGDVLFQLALINPSVVESMITIGALGTWSVKDFPEYEEIFTYDNLENISWVKAYHTSDSQIRSIFEQFKNYTVSMTDNQLKSIRPEVLIMLGDDDIGIPMDEVARARKYLPKSDLWILPNVSHGAHEGENKEEFIKISKGFLSKK